MLELLQLMWPFDFLTQPAAIVSLTLIGVLFLYWYGMRGFADLKILNVPCPKPLPFLGNYFELRKYNSAIHLMLFDYVKKYGKVFAVCLGGRPSLVVAEPELLKQILIKDFPNFRNRFQARKSPPPMDKSLLNAKNNTWKRIRNTLTPTFSAGKMKLMVPLIEKSCDTLVEKLEEIADSVKSVNILELFNQLTLEVILTTAFAVDANIQMGENTEMIEKAKGILRIPQIIRLLGRLPFGNSLLGLLESVKGNQSYFPEIAKQIIKSRRQQGPTGRKDLLQLMMNANDETTEEQASRLTDDEIVAQCVIFLLAGFETSSNTLGFTLYYLAVNPDVQDKLRVEIKDAIELNAKKPLSEVAQHIEYLDCIIKESQRLCPTLAQVNRECSEDYDLNGIHIPAGTEILIPIYFLHHDPDAWTDPEKFDPERFRSPGNDGRHALQFLPFGAGPRNCIGMRFALMEIKIALVKILTKFRFEKSPETQVPLAIQPGFTLSAKDGVYVRVSKVCV